MKKNKSHYLTFIGCEKQLNGVPYGGVLFIFKLFITASNKLALSLYYVCN